MRFHHLPLESMPRGLRVKKKDEARARKKEPREIEAARRASLTNGEAHRIRAIESDAGTFSSTDVAIAGGTGDRVVDEDTTERIQTTEVVGSAEPDPPTC